MRSAVVQQLALEMDPVNPYATQRWKHRKQSWRHVSDHTSARMFDRSRYDILEIPDDTTARAFVEAHHYSGTYPAAVRRYGMMEGDTLVGVAVLSSPMRESVLTRPFPDLEPYVESLELGRFFLLDEVPANGESFFLARVWELAAKAGIRGVVSFSDPVARTDVQQNVIFPGHIGQIYQICGAQYAGRTTPRTLLLLRDGTALNERALQKIRAQESGAQAAEDQLVKYGATRRAVDEDPRSWLTKALGELEVRGLRHRGNHRYLFRPDKKRKKTIRIGLPVLPYPQREAPH
jgi:hypothetical protein